MCVFIGFAYVIMCFPRPYTIYISYIYGTSLFVLKVRLNKQIQGRTPADGNSTCTTLTTKTFFRGDGVEMVPHSGGTSAPEVWHKRTFWE